MIYYKESEYIISGATRGGDEHDFAPPPSSALSRYHDNALYDHLSRNLVNKKKKKKKNVNNCLQRLSCRLPQYT